MNLLCTVFGFFIGLIFAAIPGLTATLAIVLLLPLTYSMEMNMALCMCMGIYMSGMYGGSITAIGETRINNKHPIVPPIDDENVAIPIALAPSPLFIIG